MWVEVGGGCVSQGNLSDVSFFSVTVVACYVVITDWTHKQATRRCKQ